MEVEFTGSYYRCLKCEHIYDYNDLCPECGSSDVEDINASEVKPIKPYDFIHNRLKEDNYTELSVNVNWVVKMIGERDKENERLYKMLALHDDI